jgi:hypothetical protein
MDCNVEKFEEINLEQEIYLCGKCKQYHKCEENQRINMAITYLNINKLKEILLSKTKEELLNYKYRNFDILELFLGHLMSFCTSKDRSIDTISYRNFDEDSIFYLMGDQITKKLILDILELICSSIPELILEKHIVIASEQRATAIINILTNYYIEKNDDDNKCYVCFSSHGSNLINNTCSCKNMIHLECLIKITRQVGIVCQACKINNGGVIEPNGRLIYPFNNIYRMPLMNNYLIVEDTNMQLHYAITYLQCARVEEILKNFTKEQYINYRDKADYYALHSINKDTGSLILKDVPYSNIPRKNNFKLFNEMEKLLLYYHLNFMY